MQIQLPRSEILRLVQSTLGMQTGSDLGSQVEEQHVAAINAAALKVQQECAWVTAQKRVTIQLGAEQNVINYPKGCSAGSIRGMAVYDTERYYPLAPRIIPVFADQDQQQAQGGTLFQRQQGRPRFFEQREQIYLWPYSDKAYPVRLDIALPITMLTPDTVSVVDAQLIIYAAVAMIATQRGDTEMRDFNMKLYGDRRNSLMAWQSQGTTFAMDSETDIAEEEFFDPDLIPRWDRRPTIQSASSNGP